jgi:hypothetical protein
MNRKSAASFAHKTLVRAAVRTLLVVTAIALPGAQVANAAPFFVPPSDTQDTQTTPAATLGKPTAPKSAPTAAPGAPAPAAQPSGAVQQPSTPQPPSTAPAGPAPAPTRSPPALDAESALSRSRDAYEYGDIDEMIDAARQVAEGRLHPTPAQRAFALRYLGIGLFLTGRPEGAETAFFELLRLRPESRLNPQTTRPDVVAFFEQVRLQYAQPIREAERANNRKTFLWNFLPPVGQFQNGHRGRAFTIGGLELVSLATAVTTNALLVHWEKPGHTFDDYEQARAVKIVNYVSVATLIATAVFGVVDGIAHYGDLPDDAPVAATTRLSISPTGFALDF